jgi:hypothetical protein
MNVNSGAQTQPLHHGQLGIAWKQWLAGAGILILTGFGLHYAIPNWLRGDIQSGLLSFGSFVGPAVAYAFAYFWCLPDVLGGTTRIPSKTLLRRWSDFALLATFIALLIINISYIKAIRENFSYLDLGRAVVVILAFAWLLPACVVASEIYLGWTMPRGETRQETGWRALVRRAVDRFGSWLVTLVGAKRALGLGAGLTLLSLILAVRPDIFGPQYKGYEIAGGSWWPATIYLHGVEALLVQLRHVVYVLGLAVAALAFVGVLGGRLARVIRGSRILATAAGIIALLGLSDLGDRDFGVWWTLLWIVPIAIWLGFARGSEDRRNHTRLAVMVYYLPIFLFAFAFLPFNTYLAPGFGTFVAGTLLVWWGFVQSRREATPIQNPHPQ